MTNGYKYIEDLLERFFDGETSNEEERKLYWFFAQENIPVHLRRYKPVFGYFENELKKEMNQLPGASAELIEGVRHKKPKRRIGVALGIAASLLILLIVSHLFVGKANAFNPYEGSYIVRNGVRITDISVIKPELEATIRKALLQEEEANRLLSNLTEPETRFEQIQQRIDRQNEEIINRFPDEMKESIRSIIENK
ncbi:MAG: hypothetical protein LBL58_19510 [Tannerellaceae bacterium]|jgi:hypothetical protein|nr:hypothetical protein [Tannerellaceae bacterium]